MQLRYLDYLPVLAPPFSLAPGAAVIGRAVVGPGLTLQEHATLRADGEWIRIGANAFFGERATVHIADSVLGTTAGGDVTVGRYALVHACTVEDRVVVGDTAVIMDGAHVGAGALIAAGSLVPPRKQLPGGWIYAGNPATPLREIDAAELSAAAAAIRGGLGGQFTMARDVPAIDVAPEYPVHAPAAHIPRVGRAYVAPTAVLAGDVEVADDVGVYFGCVVRADGARITIGPRANVQDNSLLVTASGRGDIRIAADVTIGHNVRMGSAIVEEAALIGMGSELGDGVVVRAGGCIGARAFVEPGTEVEAGWIWAGRPARPFRRVKAEERAAFARGAATYVRYEEAYRAPDIIIRSIASDPSHR
jgi:carbonic anhydrase/acetyltransferase-like protein (isoleucine patch superfamily)